MLPSNADMMALLEKGFMIQAQQMNGGGPSKK